MKEKEQQLIEEFAMFDDWMDKYNYIIELGKELPMIEEQYKTADYLIDGCQSQVWLHPATAMPSSPRASSICSYLYYRATRRRKFSTTTSPTLMPLA